MLLLVLLLVQLLLLLVLLRLSKSRETRADGGGSVGGLLWQCLRRVWLEREIHLLLPWF